MKKLITFPTWVLTGFIRPFLPKCHSWKNKRFTLKNWSDNSTELNDAISVTMWVGFLECVIILFIIYK